MTADEEVYPVGDWWAWRHQCPRGGWLFRQYHHTRERAVGQAVRHRAACDAYIPFFYGADILMYISPDWAPWIPGPGY